MTTQHDPSLPDDAAAARDLTAEAEGDVVVPEGEAPALDEQVENLTLEADVEEAEGEILLDPAILDLPEPPVEASVGQESPADVVDRLRQAAQARLAHPRRFRVSQLKGLRRLLEEETEAICQALAQDLGKPATEARMTEVQSVVAEIEHALLHLTDWMEPTSVKVPLAFQPASARIEARPLGMVLVIAPWNYPVQLLLAPLVGALAAGNTVVLKPSEKVPAVSELMARLIPQYLDPRAVAVVQGGADAVQGLLEQTFDHIFYTGGERVGKIVYRAAAEKLTPVTLELGGKSPCVVADGRNWGTIARRIAWGKFTNAGQTCVAPDYILAVGQGVQARLEKHLPQIIREFYGEDPQQSKDYGRMVSTEHAQHVADLLERTVAAGARVVSGGRVDVAQRYIEPTVLADVPVDSAIMSEEIFGPVLPILRVDTFDEAVEFINERPHPLAAYLFTDRFRVHRSFEERVTAGGMGFDACLVQLALPTLPFGGVGASGLGAYHGKAGFDTFSQQRPAFTKTDQVDTLRVAYPPYNWAKRQAIKHLL